MTGKANVYVISQIPLPWFVLVMLNDITLIVFCFFFSFP